MIRSNDHVWVNQRTNPDGTIVCGHWRRQKPALTAEQVRERERERLLEKAKQEQRDLGMET